MADVLRIALNRREDLRKEGSELDDFIRMAEKLIRTHKDTGAASDADSFQFTGGEVRTSTSGVSKAG